MSIWFKNYTVEELNELSRNSMTAYLGIEFIEVGEKSVVATMPVDHRTVQPFKILHGGASAALAETLGSVAAMMCIDTNKQIPVGLELNINHIRSENAGEVFGTATPIHIGKTTQVWQIEIRNAQKDIVATSRLTVLVKDRKL